MLLMGDYTSRHIGEQKSRDSIPVAPGFHMLAKPEVYELFLVIPETEQLRSGRQLCKHPLRLWVLSPGSDMLNDC